MKVVFSTLLVMLCVPAMGRPVPSSNHGSSNLAVPAVDSCTALLNADFSNTEDAPARVASAKRMEATTDAPALCLVEGYVDPQVGFELRLPLSNWNGKLVAVGNAGWGGEVNGRECDRHLQRGYACVASDTGHRGPSSDGQWAVNNLAAQVDFGYRSVHVMTLASKAILNRYYSKEAARSYFVGCSTGGYEGLVEAQRFPWDFDGIIAGAPDMDEASFTMRELWGSKNFVEPDGRPLLNDSEIQLLHKAVLSECDKDDGVVDGIVSNPRRADLTHQLLCKAVQQSECLTAHQIEAIRRIYAGPPIPGLQTSVRGVLPGSE